jgi:CubicO group peptidase (beta-lactamase class C family)
VVFTSVTSVGGDGLTTGYPVGSSNETRSGDTTARRDESAAPAPSDPGMSGSITTGAGPDTSRRGGLTSQGVRRLDRVMAEHVARGSAAGAVWAVARHGEVHVGVAGTTEEGGAGVPIRRDTIFRLSSMTKPITAVAVLALVEDCVLRLDDPVDELLPELAARRVLRHPDGPLDDTVPARRPITVRDVLTFRLGLGMDLANWERPQPVLERIAALGLGGGAPQPQVPPEPDEWMRRLATVPLAHQPGEGWRYDVGADVAGVLVARASGMSLPAFLRRRIFEPLGMHDTGFSVPPEHLHRFGPLWFEDPAGGVGVFDPVDGQWSTPPAFPSGAAGLVSTVDDYLAFAEMLLGGGAACGVRILSPATVEAMVSPHVPHGPDPDGHLAWGFGLAVRVRQAGIAQPVGTYGWDGGLGSSWANDPVHRLIGIVLTNRAWSSPRLPRIAEDFWTAAAAAMG